MLLDSRINLRKTVEIQPREYTNLQETTRSMQERLVRVNSQLQEAETRCETHTKLRNLISGPLAQSREDIITGINNEISEDSEQSIAKTFICDQFINVQSQVERLVAAVASNRDSISTRKDSIVSRLKRYSEQLERMEANQEDKLVTIDKTALMRELEGVEGVKPGSVLCGYMHGEQDSPCISWVFSGLKFKPHAYDFPWLHMQSLSALPEIPLVDIRVYINLTTHAMRMVAADIVLPASMPYVWNGENRVHPHVIGSNEPCLGDFAGPVTEAIKDKDWRLVATHLMLFLSQADPNDSAGATWYKGLPLLMNPSAFYAKVRRYGNWFYLNAQPDILYEKDDGVLRSASYDPAEDAEAFVLTNQAMVFSDAKYSPSSVDNFLPYFMPREGEKTGLSTRLFSETGAHLFLATYRVWLPSPVTIEKYEPPTSSESTTTNLEDALPWDLNV